jgi:hypothetical protein
MHETLNKHRIVNIAIHIFFANNFELLSVFDIPRLHIELGVDVVSNLVVASHNGEINATHIESSTVIHNSI